MNIRQCFALGVIGGITSLAGVIVYRRKDPDVAMTTTQPLFPLFSAAMTLMLILALTFVTPISTEEIQNMFYVILIVIGVLQAVVGGVIYTFFPEKTARQLQTSSHELFQFDIGVTYVATGLMLCVAGGSRTGALPVVVFLSVFCWARLVFHIWRIFSLPKKTEPAEDDTPSPPQYVWVLENYTDALCPILVLSFYVNAFCYD